MPGHDVEAGLVRDGVAFGDGELAVDFEMYVGQDHVARLARLQVVHAEHAGRGEDFGGDAGDLFLVGGAVGQVVQGIPGESPAHARDHEADDERGDRVEQREAEQVAGDADGDDQRRGGVGTGMPGIGDEHAGAHALGDGEHVAKEQFLGEQGAERDPQGDHMHGRNAFRRLQLVHRGPDHAAADR